MYPRKPKELADDLESFVYVPLYCGYRYQKHELSPTNADALKTASLEAQAEANHKNRALADDKHMLFYKERRHDNGLYSGGNAKFKEIRNGVPPIVLVEGPQGPSPLPKLLDDCYAMLHQHYQTIDFDKLKRYKADSPPPSNNRRPPRVNPTRRTPHIVNPFDFINGRRRKNASARFLAHPPGTSNATGTRAATSPNTGSPLEDHEALLDIFESAFLDEDEQPIDVTPFLHDKLFDQFDNNTVMSAKSIKNPSNKDGSSKNPKKRTSDHIESAAEPLKPNKTGKRTAYHGYEVSFSLGSDRGSDTPGAGAGTGTITWEFPGGALEIIQ